MRLFGISVVLLVCACNSPPAPGAGSVKPEPPAKAQAKAVQPNADTGPAKLGAPIVEGVAVALTEVAKNPSGYKDKSIITTGTVTAICEHAGCWMEIKDDLGSAHIKMAGHAFTIPRSASGRKARVQASLLESGQKVAGHHDDCNAEAEQQTGKPLPQLQLVATGVELL
jgi:hypothetical protein